MVRYFYTEMNVHPTTPLYKPLFFEFADDIFALDAEPHNIMLGSAFKLSI